MQVSHPPISTQCNGILRLALPSLLWILLFSIIIFGLSISWGNSVAHDKEIHFSTTALVFYCGTVPLLSILSTTLTLALYLTSRLTPITALGISITLCVGWIIQTSIWADCEFVGPNINEHVSDYCPGEGPSGTGVGKWSLAWAVVTGCLVLVGLTAYGIAKGKKAARRGVMVKEGANDEEELSAAGA